MKAPEYIVHGTSSEKDAKSINEQGFHAEEGLIKKLQDIEAKVEADDFDIGAENLNRYIKLSLHTLLGELQGDKK